jgi:rSAM/selenodomain-associated transferase 2
MSIDQQIYQFGSFILVTMNHNNNETISIIIPALNEAQNIERTIISAQASEPSSAAAVEIIVVDGGSIDATVEIAQTLGAKIILAGQGRAHQMNVGAQVATGQILLFLHADTCLPAGFDRLVRAALQKHLPKSPKTTIAGAFELKINGEASGLRLVEWGVKWRSRWWQMPYGDQAIFLRAETFQQVGGFPVMPLMEDFALISRLQKLGAIKILSATVVTSDRRWQQKGILKTTILNQIIVMAYLLGVAPDRLAKWYRSQRS